MKVQSLDSKVYEAANVKELATALWQSKFDPEPTIQEWMQGSASRAEAWNGAALRTDSEEHHIEDMLSAGLLTLLED